MKYKCDNCKKVFEEGDEIIAVNNNVGGLSLMENTLSKKWVTLCNDCFQQMKAQLVDEGCWRDLEMIDTDTKYFWHIGGLQEVLKKEDAELGSVTEGVKKC
jgi:hypothetical protein